MKKLGKGPNAANYLLGKKKNGMIADYYLANETRGVVNDPTGMLKKFGIKHGDSIPEYQIRNLFAGLHPKTGKPLLKVSGSKHVAGMDIAPASPKSFSALWAAAPLEIRIVLEGINRKATNASLEHLNKFGAYTREGHGGKNHIKANFFSFQFQHGANRNQDPHLHLHNAVMNLTLIEGKEEWRTLEMRHLMQWQTSANAVYMATLIDELRKLGIEVEIIDHHFEIVGVPPELVELWSSRKNDMLDAAEKEGIEVDDLAGMDRMHSKTRKDKRPMSTDPHGEWTEQAAKFGFNLNSIKELFRKTLTKEMIYGTTRNNEPGQHGIPSGEQSGANSTDDRKRVYENGISYPVSEHAASARERFVENVKALKHATQIGLRTLSRLPMVHAGKGNSMFLSPNVFDQLPGRSGASERMQRTDVSYIEPKRLTDEQVMAAVRTAILQAHETEAVISENNLHRAITENLFGESPERINDIIDEVKSGKLKVETLGYIQNLGEEKEDHLNKITYFTSDYFKKIENDLSVNAKALDSDGKHALNAAILDKEIAKLGTLTEEQADSCRHLFSSGSLKIGEGAAGVGKTYAMKAVAAAYIAAGYRVFAVAQADAQKEVLGEDLDLPVELRKNIAQLQSEISKGKLIPGEKDVFILDEGGLVGSQGMLSMTEIAKKFGSKLIITGEEGQLSPVTAGPGFQIVMRNVKKVSQIETIIRQKQEWQREMVQNFRKGEAEEGLNALDAHGCLKLHKNLLATKRALIDDWNGDRLKDPKSSSLILSLKNSDTRQLNVMARECLKRSGDITGEDFFVDCDTNKEKGKFARLPFAVGDHIILGMKDRDLKIDNGTRARITSIKPNSDKGYLFEVTTKNGRKITIDSQKYVDPKSKAFTVKHGYAISKWPSQGLTVDKTYVLGGEDDLRYSYVGLSRFKHHAALYVSEEQIKQKIREFRDGGEQEADEGKVIDRNDILKYLEKRMNRKSIKLSTLDFIKTAKSPNVENDLVKATLKNIVATSKEAFNQMKTTIKNLKLENLKEKFTIKNSRKSAVRF